MSYAVDLQNLTHEVAEAIGIDADIWGTFNDSLDMLKRHNLKMYAHSLRVGLYAYGVAVSEAQDDLHFPLMAGCGHDMGKCYVVNELLDCETPLTAHDFEVIHRHPADGYELLKDKFPYTALVAGLHHKFGPKAYGIDIDACCPEWIGKEGKEKIISMAKQVMICDFFDAMTTRKNASSLVEDQNDMHAVATVMQKFFPEFEQRVKWLTDNKIEVTEDGREGTQRAA